MFCLPFYSRCASLSHYLHNLKSAASDRICWQLRYIKACMRTLQERRQAFYLVTGVPACLWLLPSQMSCLCIPPSCLFLSYYISLDSFPPELHSYIFTLFRFLTSFLLVLPSRFILSRLFILGHWFSYVLRLVRTQKLNRQFPVFKMASEWILLRVRF